MTWIYHQSTGKLVHGGSVIATGYSGFGIDKNRPSSEHKRNRGPIPKGKYRILEPRLSTKTGPYVLPLEPKGHSAHGRSAFQIHGDSRKRPGEASTGCIILPRHVRQKIWDSGDHLLEVRP